MFNPLYTFTKEVLDATVKRGCLWFVRNTYQSGYDHFDGAGSYLITHFNDPAMATAHYNSIGYDPHRYLYFWDQPEHRKRLEAAAAGPPGFKIYSAYFLEDYKNKINNRLKDKINRYMYSHTNWQPTGGETLHIDFYLQFGALYIAMKYAGEELKIKFADIEKQQ
jgi:hypothetical protein